MTACRERRNRSLERSGLSNLLRDVSETKVASAVLPWSMRMMIRLNAIPWMGVIEHLCHGSRGVASRERETYDNLDYLGDVPS